jgi:hypothetical protein
MKVFAVVATLLTAVSAVYATGLQVETTYKPVDCPLQSKNGDKLSMQ